MIKTNSGEKVFNYPIQEANQEEENVEALRQRLSQIKPHKISLPQYKTIFNFDLLSEYLNLPIIQNPINEINFIQQVFKEKSKKPEQQNRPRKMKRKKRKLQRPPLFGKTAEATSNDIFLSKVALNYMLDMRLRLQRVKTLNYSFAGQVRIESLKLFDKANNPLDLQKFNWKTLSICFVHKATDEIQYQGKIIDIQNDEILVEWIPKIKGFYELILNFFFINKKRIFINGILIKNKVKILILANMLDSSKTEINFDNNDLKLYYLETYTGFFSFNDQYNNIYTEIENQLLNDGKQLISLSCKNCKIIPEYQSINLEGLQNFSFKFDTELYYEENQEKLSLISYDNKLIKTIDLLVFGLFEENKPQHLQNFLRDNVKIKRKKSLVFIFKRQYFESLIKEFSYDNAFKGNLEIHYNSDASFSQTTTNFEGLRLKNSRESWRQTNLNLFFQDLGRQMQLPQFFTLAKPNGKYYYISPNFGKEENSEQLMGIFGSLIANSIYSQYKVGISFIPSFWKYMFKYPIKYQDLFDIQETEVYAQNIAILNMNESELYLQKLTFTMIDSNGEEIELKEGGKSIPIDMSNREDYLTAKAYYLLITKNEQALEAFRTGFEKFFPLIYVAKWVPYYEMHLLTDVNQQQSTSRGKKKKKR